MKAKPEELESFGYKLIDKLNHQELIPFIQLYIKKNTFYARLYFVLNVALFFSLALRVLQLLLADPPGATVGDALSYSALGIALAFLLVPLHELLHVAAYRYLGAKETSFDANWKKFYFFAIADKFVVNKNEFKVVALAPFLAISIALIILIPLSAILWSFVFHGMLFMHTAFCSGDFGLLSYFEHNKHRHIVTYDDKNEGVSYFFERIG